MPRRSGAAVLVALALTVTACSGADEETATPGSAGTSPAAETTPAENTSAPAQDDELDPARFSAAVDHPLVPLSSVRRTVFQGRDTDPESGETVRTRVEHRVLDRTEAIAGVASLVVAVREFEDGELVEATEDYYAQRDDGSVWYMGERVNDYEDGKLVGHEGQWLAGEGDAKAGLFMPADPQVGVTFEQERAPGIAEDRSTVVEVGVDVTVPAGSFSDCIKTEDFAPLDKSTEFKYYCPTVGLVREEGQDAVSNLVRYE